MIVQIGSIEVNTFPESYEITSSGGQINRIAAAYDDAVYAFDKGENLPDYTSISLSGLEVIDVINSIKSLYQAKTMVSFTDMYGHTYNEVIISNFTYTIIKATGAAKFSLNLIILDAANLLFKINGSITHMIESFEMSNTPNKFDAIEAGVSTKILVKTLSPKLYNFSMSGVEKFNTGLGTIGFLSTLGDGVISITLPNGLQVDAVIMDIKRSGITGVKDFQSFSVSGIAAIDGSIFIEGGATGTIITQLSIKGESGRFSIHNILGGTVVQSFPPVTKLTGSITALCDVGSLGDFTHGGEASASLAGLTISGIVTDVSYSTIAGRNDLYNLQVQIVELSSAPGTPSSAIPTIGPKGDKGDQGIQGIQGDPGEDSLFEPGVTAIFITNDNKEVHVVNGVISYIIPL